MRPHPAHFGLRWKEPPIKYAQGAKTASMANRSPKATTRRPASESTRCRVSRRVSGEEGGESSGFVRASIVPASVSQRAECACRKPLVAYLWPAPQDGEQ